ncbi:hypothetical protein M436DRAFT_59879 [Aureobasidium namibiae CBS 147.97]|uniref:Uncharacterized protein n=1 Tax=Aureobasidium namibiae CBS 147.97 TaxID=1043004 RepID=A0A074WXG7_9PEZI
MSLALGKRKRAVTSKTTLPSKKATLAKSAPTPPAAPEPESDAEDREALNEAFRRAFEKRFKAIEEDKPEEVEDEEEELDEDEDEDWDGLSEEDEDDEDEVEVVEHNMSNFSRERADKAALKAFMSSKPPTSTDSPSTTTKQPSKKKDEDTEGGTTEQENLKDDLALQRLLKESHLLDATSLSTDPSGKNRHKATDLRLLELGSKTSIFAQKNMPKHQRVGIQKKKESKEFERRREAKENGIVLERVRREGTDGKGGGFGGGDRRERGIGNPSVGKFSGGTLRLSKRDVDGITGPKSSGRGGRGVRNAVYIAVAAKSNTAASSNIHTGELWFPSLQHRRTHQQRSHRIHDGSTGS